MALPITITDAGRAEIINAQKTGTGPVTITEIGFGTGQYTPTKTRTALQAQVKRVSSIAGQAVAADTIHVMAMDESSAAYNVGEFGLFSDKGTLIAVYSQPAASGWIIQKAGASTLLLATDIILESLNATSITFGDISFINPPATTTVQGVVELATPEETQTGTDGTRAVTPAGLKSLTGTTARPGLVQLNNTLTSTSTSQALTAAQGKKLQEEKQPLNELLTAFGLNNGWGVGSQFVEIKVDLNEYKTGGKFITPSGGLLNLPSGWVQSRHVIDVSGGTGYAVQVLHGAGANIGRSAIRVWDGSNWSTWRELWHSGNLVKQAGVTDNTPGAVMSVGGFGLGGSVISLGEPNLNEDRPTGFYYCSSPTNSPAGAGNGWLIQCRLDNGEYAAQTFIAFGHPTRAFHRTKAGVAIWGAWREVFYTDNLSLFAQTLLDDVDAGAARETLGLRKQDNVTDAGAGRVMTVGAFGLGGAVSTVSHDYSAMPAGSRFEYVNSVASGAEPNGDGRGGLASFVTASGYGFQLAARSDVDRISFRRSGSSLQSWRELWHAGNLVKQVSSVDATSGSVMLVGAFGLGGSVISLGDPNLNEDRPTGFYYCSSPTNSPAGAGNGWLMQFRLDNGDYATQTYIAFSPTPRVFQRTKTASSTWGAWVEALNTGNVSPFAQTLLDDANAAAARSTLGIYVADGGLGYGQAWQDVTASRTWATTYTNTTGKPIQVSVISRDPNGGNLSIDLYISGVKVANHYLGGSTQATVSAIVPPGATYRVERTDTNDTILGWLELR